MTVPAPNLGRTPILVLGGTKEARELVEALAQLPDLHPILSLSGRTAHPATGEAETRRGGYGGVQGLRHYLQERRVAALIDATHPFAAHISHNAAEAAQQAQIPFLRLTRPAWTEKPGEKWLRVASLEEAAEAPPAGSRVFLGVGPGGAESFKNRTDLWCAIRRIDPTDSALPVAQGRWIIGRPSSCAEEERALFEKLQITCLIAKNSGGVRAKLDAAQALGLEVVMVERPVSPTFGAEVQSVDAAVRWATSQR